MNERIKELADRLWRVGPRDLDAMGLTYRKEFYEQELKKFAQEIVRECMGLAEKYAAGGAGSEFDVGYISCANTLKDEFKEHFGVEE
jgi:hypothetical protein